MSGNDERINLESELEDEEVFHCYYCKRKLTKEEAQPILIDLSGWHSACDKCIGPHIEISRHISEERVRKYNSCEQCGSKNIEATFIEARSFRDKFEVICLDCGYSFSTGYC